MTANGPSTGAGGRQTKAGCARGPHPLGLFLDLVSERAAHDRARLRAVLEGLRRYQDAPAAPPMPPFAPRARRGSVRLLSAAPRADSGGTRSTSAAGGRPAVVVVPSLINAPHILDLAPGRSLIRHLAGEGHRTFVVDWGTPGPGERRLGLAGLVSARLVPLLEAVEGRIILVGYCLGGTLAVAAGQLLGPRLAALALIAAPWHFDGFGADARRAAASAWAGIAPVAQALGSVPVSLLNPLFWRLDEEAVIAKFAAISERAPGDPAIAWFAAVEDWANSGAPLPLKAARDLFVDGFERDRIGRGVWRVGGQPIAPEGLDVPILDAGATRDRIVPAAARLRLRGITRLDVASGHVGMVVGSRAPEGLWAPLSNWLLER